MCCVALGIGSAAPAMAESGDVQFPSGDAPAAIDITNLWANNATDLIQMSIFVENVTEKGTFHFFYTHHDHGMALLVHRSHRHTRIVAYQIIDLTHSKRVACPGAQARWSKHADVIEIEAPQSCYPGTIPRKWMFRTMSSLPGDKHDWAYTTEDLNLRRSGDPIYS